MKEVEPKPKYKSEWDENGNFVWKEGVDFRLSGDQEDDRVVYIHVYLNSMLSGRAEVFVDTDATEAEVAFDIHQDKKGNNLGAALVEAVNFYLDQHGYVGSLVNLIGRKDFDDRVKYDLYERHGWKHVGNQDMKRKPGIISDLRVPPPGF